MSLLRYIALAGVLLLAGCGGAHYAADARVWAVGKPIDDLESCIGAPFAITKLPAGDTLYQWNTSDAAQSLGSVPVSVVSSVPLVDALTLPALALPVTLGGGSCRALARVRRGVVTGLRYSGPGDGVSGRDAECGVDLLRGCLR